MLNNADKEWIARSDMMVEVDYKVGRWPFRRRRIRQVRFALFGPLYECRWLDVDPKTGEMRLGPIH